MPDVIGRDELERRLARVVASEQRKALNELLDLLGDPPDPARVPPSYWQNGGAALQAAVEPVLREVYLAQAEAVLATTSIGLDWALVNQAAVDWARRYSFDLVTGITETNQGLLQTAVGNYFAGPTAIGDLERTVSNFKDMLGSAYGPVRAEMISITEITRAASAGEQVVVDRLLADNPGIKTVDVWQTNRDDRVCVICGPRHGKKRGDNWTDNPPAHPRCRCWVTRDFKRANVHIEIVATMDVSDLEQLATRLGVVPALKDGVEAAGIFAADEMSMYPIATEANVAGPYPKKWYVRGTGSFWALKNGGFHSNASSQTLGKRWTSTPLDGGLSVVVGNNASYAKVVHDDAHQAPFHKKRGWKTVQEFVRTQSAHVREIIADFIHARIEGQK